MLSRLLLPSRQGLALVLRQPTISPHNVQQNIGCKRWGGHAAKIPVAPSSYDAIFAKDMILLHAMLVGIPVAVIMAIINTRANPELTEIPEGYEPRHWEYYRHPIARFMARYVFYPQDIDFEMVMDWEQQKAEELLKRQLTNKVHSVMAFYNDHRSYFFKPVHGDYVRRSRDQMFSGVHQQKTATSVNYELAYDPKERLVPVEGYRESTE